MSKVHVTRLKDLARELDIGLRISNEILIYPTGKPIEVCVTLDKNQAKLEGRLFWESLNLSANYDFHSNASLDEAIRKFVSRCRDIKKRC